MGLLNDDNFMLDGDGEFHSMYLEDIDDSPVFNPGIAHPRLELPAEDYGDMVTKEQPDKDDLENKAINKYINAELIFSVSTNNERKGCMTNVPGDLSVNLLVVLTLTLSLNPRI